MEDVQIEQIQNSIEEHQKILSLTQDFDQFLAVKVASRRLAIEASNFEAKHAFRSAVCFLNPACIMLQDDALNIMNIF